MAGLREKVALITGASSGIGAATAMHFATLGSKLSLTGRNEVNLLKVASDCRKEGVEVIVTVGDVCNEDDTLRIVENTINHYQRLDVLVNCASILLAGTAENTSMNDFDDMMKVNVRSIFHLSQLAIPHLKKTKGNIVNISSVTGLRSFPGVISYCMSKAAIDQFTRCAALELAESGVRVNSVNPGVIVTEVHKRGGMSEEDYAKFLEHCKHTHPLGRVGTAHEVAQAVSFLADDTSGGFITGINIPVDGGRGVTCLR